MELIKKLLKYFLILLVVVLLVLGLLAGILFFFPNANIFGFRHISSKNDSASILISPTITEVNIETNNYDIVIVPNAEKDVAVNNRFRIVFENNYMGFSNHEHSDVMIEKLGASETNKYVSVENFSNDNVSNFVQDGKFTIKLNEPDGIMFYNNSRVIFYMPENVSNVVYNLKTNKGDITFEKNSIKPEKLLSTSNITIDVKSSSGSFNLDNAKMTAGSNLTVSNFLGKVNINSENIGNVIINSNSGNFTFNDIGFYGCHSNLTINGNNPYVNVNKVYGNVNIKSTTGYLKAKTVVGDIIAETDNGLIEIEKALGSIEINNKSGRTFINQIGSSSDLAKSANIISKSGDITLGGSEDTDAKGIYYLNKVSAESSKVKITNLYVSNSEVETTKGSVNVTFANNNVQKDFKVTTVSGAITLKNVFGQITAQTDKSSKIYAEYVGLTEGGVSTFTTDEGDVELIMPMPTENVNKQYNLNLQNRRDKLDISVGNYVKTSFGVEKDGNGYYNLIKVFPDSVATTNTINVKTNSGKIIVKEN